MVEQSNQSIKTNLLISITSQASKRPGEKTAILLINQMVICRKIPFVMDMKDPFKNDKIG